MPSDASLDDQIKVLEQSIRDHRVAVRDSVDDLAQQARMAKQQLRRRATSPIVWGAALVIGFLAAQLARRARTTRHRESASHRWSGGGRAREDKPVSTGRQVVGAVLSAAVPIALRVARQSAGPWIARQVQAAQQAHARRRAQERGYSRH